MLKIYRFSVVRPVRAVIALVGVYAFFVLAKVGAMAQDISAGEVSVSSTYGTKLTTLATILNFVANLMKYVGWAGVIIGVILVIALLIYKLIGSDDAETMKKVQGGITKAVIIVILGILLLSAGFILSVVQQLVGANYQFEIDQGTLGTGAGGGGLSS